MKKLSDGFRQSVGPIMDRPLKDRRTRIAPPAIQRTGRLIPVMDLVRMCITIYSYVRSIPRT